MKWKYPLIILALLLLGTLVAAPFVLADDPPAHRPQGGVFLIGKIKEIGEDSFQVQTPEGLWTVTVTNETKIKIPGVENPSLEDLREGKGVLVKGQVIAAGQMQATLITAPKERENRPYAKLIQVLRRARRLEKSVRGKVLNVAESSFSMQVGEEELTIQVNEETVFHIPDVSEPSLADLEPGQLAVVHLLPGEEHIARSVAVVSKEQMRRINAEIKLLRAVRRAVGSEGLRGQVKSIQGETLVLSLPQGEVTIHVNEDTRFAVRGKENASLEDIQVGDTLLVLGKPDLSCPINASHIVVLPEHPPTEE